MSDPEIQAQHPEPNVFHETPPLWKPASCPFCDHGGVVPILYGLPSDVGRRWAEAGLVRLGGCALDERSPQFECRSCGHRWRESSQEDGPARRAEVAHA